MYTITCDVHTHTLASGHAYGTIREMAQAASEKGLSVLGITEHAPGVPGTTDPFYYLCLNLVPRTLYGVRVIHGCEINILNDGSLSLEERYMVHLDFAIAGIHTTCYRDAGKIKNTENVISALFLADGDNVHVVYLCGDSDLIFAAVVACDSHSAPVNFAHFPQVVTAGGSARAGFCRAFKFENSLVELGLARVAL